MASDPTAEIAGIEPGVEPGAEAGPGLPLPEAAEAQPSPQERLRRMLAAAGEHEAAGRLDAAEALLGQIHAAAPEQPQALHLSGIVAFRRDRRTEGVRLVEQAIIRAPNVALFRRNLCEMYRKSDRHDDALRAGRAAAQLDPNDKFAHHNLNVLHYQRVELDEAIECAEKALAIDPEMPGAHFGIAEASLLRGDFARGWEEYEWRFRMAGAPALLPPTDKPQWDGSPLPAGQTLVLIADQGYGDVIQFARFIPWVASRCADIAIACSRALHPMIRQLTGKGRVFDRWDELGDFAAYCPLSGLPRLAGVRPDTISGEPYLSADPARVERWEARLAALLPAGSRRVGIVWAGRGSHPNDENRSMRLAALAPLGALAGVSLVSLQKGPAQAGIGYYWGRATLVNLGPEIEDFADTMAIIDRLERVVTVDTAVAHLAGAMGKEVWVMLPYAPDWRWLLDRADSPWYPSARLFRQGADRDWAPVIAAIADELR
jgi:hypothetical protein